MAGPDDRMRPSSHPTADRDRFLELVNRNPVNRAVLQRLPDLGLPDCWLVAGGLFQTVWNCLSGKPPGEDILDYDVFYHDPSDPSWDAEDSAIQRSRHLFADLEAEVQVRNQARVHLWYPEKFGVPCEPLRGSRDAIDHFLNRSSCFGMRGDSRTTEVYAPFGFDDLFAMVVRPNRRRPLPDVYHRKAARWSRAWPGLTVVPWSAVEEGGAWSG